MVASDRIVDLCSEGLLAVAPDGSIHALNRSMQRMLEAWGDGLRRIEDLPFGVAFAERWQTRDGERGFADHYEIISAPDRSETGGSVWVRAEPSPDNNWVLACSDETEVVVLRGEVRRLRRLRSLGTMISGIAHDFNNVLGSIIGFSDQLAQSPLPDEQRFFFEHMQVSASKGATLLRSVTEYLQMTRQKHERTELGSVVIHACTLIDKAAILVGTDVVHKPSEEPIWVWLDCGAAMQLVTEVCMHFVGTVSVGSEIELRVEREVIDGREFGVVVVSTVGDTEQDELLRQLAEQPEAGLLEPTSAMPDTGNSIVDALLALRLGGGEFRCVGVDRQRSLRIGYPVARG